MSELQSEADSPGTVDPTGIRRSGVPGADKGIALARQQITLGARMFV